MASFSFLTEFMMLFNYFRVTFKDFLQLSLSYMELVQSNLLLLFVKSPRVDLAMASRAPPGFYFHTPILLFSPAQPIHSSLAAIIRCAAPDGILEEKLCPKSQHSIQVHTTKNSVTVTFYTNVCFNTCSF